MSHILVFFMLFCDRKKGGERVRNRIYLRPELYDLSQGSRIKFVRIFRHLTQDNVSDDLGITGENKRRTLTRYEKGDRNPSKSRLQELSKMLLVNDNLIKCAAQRPATSIQQHVKASNSLPAAIINNINTNELTIV